MNDGGRIRASSQDSSHKFFACIFANGETLSAFKVVWTQLAFVSRQRTLFRKRSALTLHRRRTRQSCRRKKLNEVKVTFALMHCVIEWRSERRCEALSYFTVIKFRAMSGVFERSRQVHANEILASLKGSESFENVFQTKRQEVNAPNNTFNNNYYWRWIEPKLFCAKCAGKGKKTRDKQSVVH